ncbi:hypothetical protein [Gordonia paraffinivorans]|uniref:hypothetical protein n=1 Tax=Gordonia paraffinivorans TaxID=175628 RepID=UPI001B356C9E|nr:hypothetical protein [Gordonia paraffinivorans]
MAEIREDMLNSQADAYEWVEGGFQAGPLEGPGRWAKTPDGTTIYTNDDDVLFAKSSNTDSVTFLQAILAISKLSDAGNSATTAFNMITRSYKVTEGDLSEIA